MGIFCMSSMRCIFLFFFLYITRFFVGKNQAIAEPRKSTTKSHLFRKVEKYNLRQCPNKEPLRIVMIASSPGTLSNKPLATGPQAIVNFAVL